MKSDKADYRSHLESVLLRGGAVALFPNQRGWRGRFRDSLDFSIHSGVGFPYGERS